jgi:hypothetical protein
MTETRTGNQLNPAALIPKEEGTDLSSFGQMVHVVDPSTGAEYLQLDDLEHAPYPTAGEEDIIDYLLLPVTDVDGERFLHLPAEYLTFTQALDRIAEHATSDATDSNEVISDGELVEGMKDLFGKLGEQLDELVLGDCVLPKDMSIRQVLVTEEAGQTQFKLLPPLRVRSIDDGEYSPVDARIILLQQLLHSCFNSATKRVVRDATNAAFKGFIENFSYGGVADVEQALGRGVVHMTNDSPQAV